MPGVENVHFRIRHVLAVAFRLSGITGDLLTAREWHTATLLPNRKVLVAAGGGYDGYPALASAELYDPATGMWTATGSLATARWDHTATLLPNRQVLVAGGTNYTAGVLASAELYDPATGTWTATGSMTTARESHTATLLPNGQVLVAGGGTTTLNSTIRRLECGRRPAAWPLNATFTQRRCCRMGRCWWPAGTPAALTP